MSSSELPYLLGEIRELTEQYKAGNPKSFDAVRDLFSLLLHKTVVESTARVVKVGSRKTDVAMIQGGGPGELVQLTNGRFLRVTIGLGLERTENGSRCKTKTSTFQYQSDDTRDRWIFRYDYLREPNDPHPGTHLHIRGRLSEDCLAGDQPLERIHFPTRRVSMEAVIRLLIDQFHVPANSPDETWRPLLQESEKLFYEVAYDD